MSVIVHNSCPYCSNNIAVNFCNQSLIVFAVSKVCNIYLQFGTSYHWFRRRSRTIRNINCFVQKVTEQTIFFFSHFSYRVVHILLVPYRDFSIFSSQSHIHDFSVRIQLVSFSYGNHEFIRFATCSGVIPLSKKRLHTTFIFSPTSIICLSGS